MSYKLWLWDHSRSLAMSPLDTAHTVYDKNYPACIYLVPLSRYMVASYFSQIKKGLVQNIQRGTRKNMSAANVISSWDSQLKYFNTAENTYNISYTWMTSHWKVLAKQDHFSMLKCNGGLVNKFLECNAMSVRYNLWPCIRLCVYLLQVWSSIKG